jgi:hypothetical protein
MNLIKTHPINISINNLILLQNVMTLPKYHFLLKQHTPFVTDILLVLMSDLFA